MNWEHSLKVGARYGYGVKGLVFLTAGLLTLQFSLGLGGDTGTTNEALRSMVSRLGQPFGRLSLGIVGVGLVCYSLWRGVEMVFDPRDFRESRWKYWLRRGGHGVSGLAYGGLAWSAFELMFGERGRGQSVPQLVHSTLQQPWGQGAVIGAGMVAIGCGLFLGSRAISRDFRDRYRFCQVKQEGTLWLLKIARLGWIARGSVFVLMGIFAIQAGWQYNPSAAKDSAAAMKALTAVPGGRWILLAIAIGLILYSLQMLMEARYHPLESIASFHQQVKDSKKKLEIWKGFWKSFRKD